MLDRLIPSPEPNNDSDEHDGDDVSDEADDNESSEGDATSNDDV